MGTFTVPIQVARPFGSEFVSMEAVVDTGATYSVFPRDVLTGLGVAAEDNRTFDLADNRAIELPVGYATIRLAEKQIITQAVFGPPGGTALLGAIALEGAGLAVDPIRQLLVPVNALLLSGINGASGSGSTNDAVC